MIGKLVSSKQGHDKDRIYVIVDQDEDYVYLCDGTARSYNKPKRKNKKHIQIINRLADKELQSRIMNKETVYDEQIKAAIRKYSNQ